MGQYDFAVANHWVRNIKTQSKAGPAKELDAIAAMTLKKLKEQYSNMANGNTDEKNSTTENLPMKQLSVQK